MKELKSFCTLCRSQCGTINVVENGRLISVKPDPDHPTGQAVCRKGKAGPEIILANNRFLYPLRRTRPKTASDPGWERISWEEAMSACAEKLGRIREETGAESVGFVVTTKSGTAIADSVEWIDRFTRIFGSPNVSGAVDICNWHKDNAHRFTFGVGMPVADYSNASLIMLWGHNPTSTWLSQTDAISRGRAQGAALLVIDPRPIPLAKTADCWLRVRPGTDAALALGLSNVLISENRFNKEFVTRWTNGPLLVREDNGCFLRWKEVTGEESASFVCFHNQRQQTVAYDTRFTAPEEVTSYSLYGQYSVRLADGTSISCRPAFDHFTKACQVWTPERVRSICGIPETKLRHAADLLASNDKIAYHAWNGVGQSTNATQTERAIATLYALCGNFDDVGGNRIYASQPVNKVDSPALMDSVQKRKAIGIAERPLGPPAQGRIKPLDLYRAYKSSKPYSMRALVAFGTNHLVTQGDTNDIREGLEAVEFHVHCDSFETPTSRYADIILPVNLPWERESLRIGFEINEAANNLIQLRPAAVEPRGETRSDMQIVFDLAVRLGHGGAFFNGDTEAGFNYILEPLNLSAEEIRKAGGHKILPLEHRILKYREKQPDGSVTGFATATRRVELYSELLHLYGQSPLPLHPASLSLTPDYPLLVTSMKNGYYCHSQHHGVASLRRRSPWPCIYLHPKLAEKKHIQEGEWVEVRNDNGTARFCARLDPLMDESVLAAEFGWWEECEPLGLPSSAITSGAWNFNSLVSAQMRDPISGSAAHKGVPCDISRVENSLIQPWPGKKLFRVSELRLETSEAMTVELSPVDGGALPDFIPGQYLQITLTDSRNGEKITRAYSLTSSGKINNRRFYSICVGRAISTSGEPGRASSFIHMGLRIGDFIEAETPSGRFTLPLHSKTPVVMIATGVGITPFISYLETQLSRSNRPEMVLLYGSRSRDSQAFARRLSELKVAMPELTVKNFYSQLRPTDTQGKDEFAGRVNADAVSESLINLGARFYFCGSQQMIDVMTTLLIERGAPAFNIFSEIFMSPVSPALDNNQAYNVEFRRSGKKVEWHAKDGSLLELAERIGVRAPSGCRVGQCESCAVSVLAGQVAHLGTTVPEEPETALTCSCIPTSDIVLDL